MLSETFSANFKNVVYIYDDLGVSKESLTQTKGLLQQLLNPHHTLQVVDAPFVKNSDWASHAALFVMPGGIASSYAHRLNGLGNQNIKQYVKNGGAYLGICAGAYYGAKAIEFDKGGPLEVLSQRELKLFKAGKAIGPILAPYDYQTYRGARAAQLIPQLQHLPKTTVFYNGGGYFENADACPDTQVIARYDAEAHGLPSDLPAIIRTRYGEGRAILSGVHFEYDPFSLDQSNHYLKSLLPSLAAADQSRLQFSRQLLQMLGLELVFDLTRDKALICTPS